MPGDHGEIRVDEQTDKEKKTRKKKKKKGEDELAKGNLSETPSIAKPRKRFFGKMRRKPKRCSSPGCFSAMRPRRKEEECSSPASDPNDESFTHEMLRVMLETNDFYSDDCNPHG